ncbi:profilin-1-like [Lepisosteus oculatus]|uniref:profilin-1-like n=1 Tax=Lepisosteus oculatus TaxID=7918 RepID=UPI003715DC8A
MSWDGYVTSLMTGGECQDAAIVGYETGAQSVWAAAKGKTFEKLTQGEIAAVTSKDRSSFFINGVTLGGVKCSVLRDRLNEDGEWTMDLRTKSAEGQPTYNITIAKSNKALVLVQGAENIHGGILNSKAFKMAEHLRKSNY